MYLQQKQEIWLVVYGRSSLWLVWNTYISHSLTHSLTHSLIRWPIDNVPPDTWTNRYFLQKNNSITSEKTFCVK